MNPLFPCDQFTGLPHTHALCITHDVGRYVKMLPGCIFCKYTGKILVFKDS